MKIGLFNLEPKYPNLALAKIKMYHEALGDEVVEGMYLQLPEYDKVYCSSIFDFTRKDYIPPQAITGGTGFDISAGLPPEIEGLKPRLNIGFTTRGCIRKCRYCIVYQKEGYIHAVGTLLDLWDGVSRDNNPL